MRNPALNFFISAGFSYIVIGKGPIDTVHNFV